MQEKINNIKGLRGELFFNRSLARFTSWRVGGNAACYYRPSDLDDLAFFLQQISKLKITQNFLWLGLGSNLLIRDGGYPGIVIHLHKCLADVKILAEDANTKTLYVGSGTTCAKLSKFCIKHGMEDGAFFAGIPGTVGGALAMNAGAFAGETWQNVISVELINKDGILQRKSVDDFVIFYRGIKLKDENLTLGKNVWFVGAQLKFDSISKETNKIKDLLNKRNQSQPIGQLSCGSVFKNPYPQHAAKLIETANLKGVREGDAVVSMKHANFIINEGKATAADLEKLIEKVQKEVKAKHNVLLEKEVRIVGDKTSSV